MLWLIWRASDLWFWWTKLPPRHFIVVFNQAAIRWWSPLSAIIWHTLCETVNQWLLQTLQTRWTYIRVKTKENPRTDLVSDRIEVREQTNRRKKKKRKKRLLKKRKNVDVRINIILAFYDSIRLECVRSSNKHMQTCKVLPRGTMHRDKKKCEENNTHKNPWKAKESYTNTPQTNQPPKRSNTRRTLFNFSFRFWHKWYVWLKIYKTICHLQ